MRTLAGITAVLMASMTLWSCDQQQAQAPAPAAPAPQACNCTPPPPPCNCTPQAAQPAPAMAAVTHYRRHHHHHYYASEEIMPGSPGYVSDSGAVGESEYAAAQYSSSSSVSYLGPPPPGPSFVDGYGRGHFWSRGEVAHFAHQADANGYYAHLRLRPWRKYDATCDWR